MKQIMHNIFSIKNNGQTHYLIKILGFKIKLPRKKFLKKKRQSLYYYYKKNNIDITAIPPAEGQIRDIQLANLALLKELDYVCKQNHLTYWLDGGTLLGAIRHRGFIPWDDDIDVAMLRKDYEKLPDAFKKSSRNPEIFAEYWRSPMDPCGYRIKVQHKKCQHLFVDIFPWDEYGLRLTQKEQEKESKKIDKIRKELEKNIKFEDKNEYVQTQISNAMKNKILSHKNQAKCDYVWGIDFHHHWKNWFTHYEVLKPLKTIIFEDFEFPCLNNPDAFLTRLYGNYMSYPKKITMGHSMYLELNDKDKITIEGLKNSLSDYGD